jgi:hypothetical protein
MNQRRVSRRRSGNLRRGQDRRDIAYDGSPYDTSRSLQNLTTGAVVAVSSFDEVTEFGLWSQPVAWIPGDEYQLAILDSVSDGACCVYRDGSATL